ncbi:hypothetical protein C9374_007521 [Naegleria lovaniensis]|uniref:RWP-RK domain-containing protein n=1 Tax=Naegleria lovaniensis TaxID=51637 RepID=A0AA88GL33_NAELO|nr:uncharacterized protein C9374_007521 [Naegleria lovaniensis]KAG2379382.1 hypothetical protein C9374_007521 [Naegleria lovaniensis]
MPTQHTACHDPNYNALLTSSNALMDQSQEDVEARHMHVQQLTQHSAQHAVHASIEVGSLGQQQHVMQTQLQSTPVFTFTTHPPPTCMLDTTYSTHTNAPSKINVAKHDMERYFGASQVLAARLLGVSVSTLKRRFKESYEGQHRWPYHKLTNLEKRRSLWFYMNDEEDDEKFISPQCEQVLEKAFVNCTLPIEHYFPELKPKPKKKDITFLNYIPQHDLDASESLTREPFISYQQQHKPRLKGGSKQLYQVVEDPSSSNNLK